MQERLDLALVTDDWRLRFPKTSFAHLLRVFSNHNPILINLNCDSHRRFQKPFRFEVMWATHSNFERFLRQSWSPNTPVHDNIHNFTNIVQLLGSGI